MRIIIYKNNEINCHFVQSWQLLYLHNVRKWYAKTHAQKLLFFMVEIIKGKSQLKYKVKNINVL